MACSGYLVAEAMVALMRRDKGRRAAGEREDELRLPPAARDKLRGWHASFRFTL